MKSQIEAEVAQRLAVMQAEMVKKLKEENEVVIQSTLKQRLQQVDSLGEKLKRTEQELLRISQ